MPQDTFLQGGVRYRNNGDGTATVVGYDDEPIGGRDPAKQYDAPRAAAQTSKAQSEATVAQATTQSQIELANARAREAQANADKANAESRMGGGPTTGQTEADKEFAKDYLAWTTGGGMAGLETKLKTLDEALNILETSNTITGPVIGRMPKFIQQMVNPASQDVRADIEKAIQESLRQTLGAQFTAKEGESILARTYDPTQQEGSNTRRSRKLIEELRSSGTTLDSASRYFEGNGTLTGWQSPKFLENKDGQTSEYKSPAPAGFASASDETKGVRVPDGYQQAYGQYLDNNKILNPDDYAAMRIGLDKEYGFPVDPDSYNNYKDWAIKANEGTANGRPIQKTIPAYEVPMDFRDGAMNSVFANPAGSFALGAVDFHGGFDEMAAGASSMLSGKNYDMELARINAGKQALANDSPISNILGKLAGGVGGGGLFAKAAPGIASKLIAGPVSTAATGAAVGGGQGALENNQDRFAGAVLGGGAGAGGGLFGRYALGPAIESLMKTQGGQAASQFTRGMINKSGVGSVPASAQVAEPMTRGQNVIGNSSKAMDDITANLTDAQRLGLPYSLADSDPQLRMLAGTVARGSTKSRALAEDTFPQRSYDQAPRAIDAIERDLAPIVDVAERGQQWRQAAQTESNPLYAIAKSKAAPVDSRVDAFLKTDTGSKAMREARNIAENEGHNPLDLGFDLDDQGEVIIRELPSFETLDYVKRGIDQQLEAYRNPLTGKLETEGNPAATSLEAFRRRFVETLDDINPDYKQARAAYQGQIANRDALERGVKAANPNVRGRDIPRMTDGFTDTQTGEFQRGYATSMGDTVNRTRFSSDPYNNIYFNSEQKDKVGQIFGGGADNFQRNYNLERHMAATNAETTGGSQSAARLAADAELSGGMLGNLAEVGADMAADGLVGGGMSAARLASPGFRQTLKDAARFGVGKRGQETMDEIAPLLYNTDPEAGLKLLEWIKSQQAVTLERMMKSKQRGGLFGGAFTPALTTTVQE